MKRFLSRGRKVIAMVALAAFVCAATPAQAKSPVKLQKWQGQLGVADDGITPFSLEGTASHLGQFVAHGEVEFLPAGDDGALVGDGVVVFEAANGDLLVGVVEWDVDATGDGEFAT